MWCGGLRTHRGKITRFNNLFRVTLAHMTRTCAYLISKAHFRFASAGLALWVRLSFDCHHDRSPQTPCLHVWIDAIQARRYIQSECSGENLRKFWGSPDVEHFALHHKSRHKSKYRVYSLPPVNRMQAEVYTLIKWF